MYQEVKLQDEEIVENSFSENKTRSNKSNTESNKKQPGQIFLNRKKEFQDDYKKDYSGKQYQIYFLNILTKIHTKLDGMKINDKFYFSLNIHSKQINDIILHEIMNSFGGKSESEIQDVQKLLNYWPQHQQIITLADAQILLKCLTNYIQKQNASGQKAKIGGDFDLYLKDQNVSFQNQIETIFQELGGDNQKQFWKIPNYLQTGQSFKQDQQAIYIFELKKNPFRQEKSPSKGNKPKKDLTQHKKKEQKSEKQSKKAGSKVGSEKQSKEASNVIINSSFQQKFLSKLNKNNMLHNITQIIKLILAAIHRLYMEDESSFKANFNKYRQMRSQGKITYEIKIPRKSHPRIILYYVVNSNITRRQFEDKFNFFKPILKHIFKYQNAVLHIIGYTPIIGQERQLSTIQMNIITQTQSKLKNQIEKIVSQMEEKARKQKEEMKNQMRKEIEKMKEEIQQKAREERQQLRKEIEKMRKERQELNERNQLYMKNFAKSMEKQDKE